MFNKHTCQLQYITSQLLPFAVGSHATFFKVTMFLAVSPLPLGVVVVGLVVTVVTVVDYGKTGIHSADWCASS